MYKLVGFAVPRAGYGFAGAGASVQINDAITGAAATLYQDDETTTKANPLVADSTGMYEAKVLDGIYNVVITYNGGGTVTMNNVRCFDTFTMMTNFDAVTVNKGDVVQVFQGGTGTSFVRVLQPLPAGITDIERLRSLGIVMSTSIPVVGWGRVATGRGQRLAGVGSGWTPGKLVYVDSSGNKTQTKPAGLCCILGYAASATDLVFDPQDPSLPATTIAETSFDKNILINGAFDIWQRSSADAAGIAGSYHADRWIYSKSGAVVHTSQRSTSTPTDAQAGVPQRYSWNLACTTGNPSPGAAEYSIAMQPVEGTRWRSIRDSKPFVLSFWVRASKTGNLPVAIRTGSVSHSCVRRVTINAADTWEKKTITFPAATGTTGMTIDETVSVYVVFALHAGSTYQTAIGNEGVWTAGNLFGFTTGDTNFASAAFDYLRITNVQLEAGVEATPYQTRPFSEELRLCQRYYWKTFPYATAVGQNSGVATGAITYRTIIAGTAAGNSVHVRYPQQMRTTPTLTFYNPGAANSNWRNTTDGADSGASSVTAAGGADSFSVSNAQAAGDAVGETVMIHASADAEL